MFSIIAAFISTTAFAYAQLIYKKLRNRGVQPLTVLGIGAFCIPIWLVMGVTLSLLYVPPRLNAGFLVSLLGWSVIVFLSNWGSKYLYAYKSLAQLKSYSAAIGITLGLAADKFLLRDTIGVFSIIAALSLLASCFLISKNTLNKPGTNSQSLPWKILIGILAINAILDVLASTTYKIGIGLQSNIIYQVIFGQTILYGSFFISSAKQFKNNMALKLITKKDIIGIVSLLLVATFFEVFIVKTFPLVLLIVLSVIPLTIFSFYDLKNKELAFTKKNFFALALVIVGLWLSQIK